MSRLPVEYWASQGSGAVHKAFHCGTGKKGDVHRGKKYPVALVAQVFQADLIRTALARAMEEGAELTDDCGAVERLGIGVVLTQGDYRNLKVTTPEDMAMAEALLEWEDET